MSIDTVIALITLVIISVRLGMQIGSQSDIKKIDRRQNPKQM